jgi:8-oxo-dGTP pyrophosphatase MutT (NUDIX family)
VVLDPDGCILLQRIRSPDGREFWITPGGGIEDGETSEAAATRELVEEIGLRDVVLGPPIWTRRHTFVWGDRHYDQRETFYLVRLPERVEALPTIAPEQLAAEGVVDHRWWRPEDVAVLQTAPRRLASLLATLDRDGPPIVPIDVGV